MGQETDDAIGKCSRDHMPTGFDHMPPTTVCNTVGLVYSI